MMAIGKKVKSRFPFIVGSRFKSILALLFVIALVYSGYEYNRRVAVSVNELQVSESAKESEIDELNRELEELKSQDQYVINQELVASISATKAAYDEAGFLFERWADLELMGYEVEDLGTKIASVLYSLANLDYSGASDRASVILAEINQVISDEEAKKQEVVSAPQATVSNVLPGSGHSVQAVESERGKFTVSMVVAPGATVVVDTASDEDCSNECPTLPLADFVSRNGGFAGINGGYFCPPDYASCQGKTNTFDTLVYNGRIGKAFNQANNVYSTVPLVVAYGSTLSFYGRTLDWGVDGSSTGAVANYPLLLSGGNIAFDEGSVPDYLRNNKGTRGFIGTKGGSVVIGHVFAATVPEAGYVLKALGLESALNLDGGGSSALWYGGYKIGPGRTLPVAIVLK